MSSPAYARIPKNFRPEEFVSRAVFESRGSALVPQLIDYRIFETVDFIRNKRFNRAVTINNWVYGGEFQYRGFRAPDETIGAQLSQHHSGRALDFDVDGHTAAEIRRDIINNPHLYPHITCIEDGVNWVHIDCRNWNRKSLGFLIVKPKGIV